MTNDDALSYRAIPVVSPANPATDFEPEYADAPKRSRTRPGTGRHALRRARRIEQGEFVRPGPATRRAGSGGKTK